jgi:SAM-dependent methyltransferase
MPRPAASETVTYGTWIRIGRLYIFAAISAVALAGASLTLVSAWFALLLVPAALFGYIAVVLALTVWRLGPRGGDFQRRIHDLIVTRAAMEPAGRGLDIGCGSGALTIRLAKALPTTQVTGIDFWGTDWEYSKDQCERNARMEGVTQRTTFVQQSAASLRFDDAMFDVVVSCLTFHEVRDVTDRARSGPCSGCGRRSPRPGPAWMRSAGSTPPCPYHSRSAVRRCSAAPRSSLG